jgi:hypothetical protein
LSRYYDEFWVENGSEYKLLEHLLLHYRALVGPEWTINSFIEGNSTSAVNLSTSPTVVFGENGTVEVKTGCNTGSGSYTVEGTTNGLGAYTQ